MTRTTARLLDGAAVAAEIRAERHERIGAFSNAHGRPPGLGIVLAGGDSSPEFHVRNKLKRAGEAGLRADAHRLPATACLDDILAVVAALNASPDHDGIFVQSPLPPALGVMELLARSGVAIDGAHAVVIGRCDTVGKPVALLLTPRNATVTLCHSRTKNLPEVSPSADLLVAAEARCSRLR